MRHNSSFCSSYYQPAESVLQQATRKGHRRYGIMLEVAERTTQHVLMGPGTLYGTLKRMLQSGLIEECGERIDPHLNNERRRYYRITKQGRHAAVAEAERLQALVRIARAKSVLKTAQAR